jgi:Uma2 family endonuclease
MQKSQRLLLFGVDWRTYSRLLAAFAERPSIRLTYDRGTLEIMSPPPGHEFDSYLLGRFVDVVTEELQLRVKAGRSTTFRLRRKKRGLEPDNCYWILHEAQIRGKRRIDLRVDPPPDLAIEVDVTKSSLNRLSIYAALRVPEVWRVDNGALAFHVLSASGKYTIATHSLAFPVLASADVQPFLALATTLDDNAIVAQFRAWLRQRIAASAQGAP